MRIWPALLLAPLLTLLDQAFAYALAGWECARQDALAMQAVHAIFLAATLACTFAAWQRSRAYGAVIRAEAIAVRHFLARIAFASGTLSSLVIVALWIPTWLVSPCWN